MTLCVNKSGEEETVFFASVCITIYFNRLFRLHPTNDFTHDEARKRRRNLLE